MAVITSGHCALQYRIRAPAVAEAAAQLRRPRSSLHARRSAWGTSGRCQEGRPPQPGSVPHPPHRQPHHQRRKKQVDPARRECPARHGQRRRGHHDHSRIIATAGPGRAGCHLDRALRLRPSRRGLPRSQRPAWDPPTVRICLITGCWRSPVPDLPGQPGRPRALAGDRRPAHS